MELINYHPDWKDCFDSRHQAASLALSVLFELHSLEDKSLDVSLTDEELNRVDVLRDYHDSNWDIHLRRMNVFDGNRWNDIFNNGVQ